MEEGRKRTFVKCTPLYEIQLKKSDTYDMVIQKISSVINYECDSAEEKLVLLTSRGIIVSEESILIGERLMSWTLGAYLNKRHAHIPREANTGHCCS